MKFLKIIGKIILWFITLVCVNVLFALLVTFNLRSITSYFFTEDKIINTLYEIDYTEFFVDQDGNELEFVKDIKDELNKNDVPSEYMDVILNSNTVKNFVGSKVKTGIDYIVYDKKVKGSVINKKIIVNFFNDNWDEIIDDIKDKDIIDEELLTDDNKEKFLNVIEEYASEIDDGIDEICAEFEEDIKVDGKDNYKSSIQIVIEIIKLLYSNLVTSILITIIIVTVILIMISRLSFYKGLKWVGIPFVLTGLLLLFIALVFSNVNISYSKEVPAIMNNLIINFTTESANLFYMHGLITGIIGIVLIIINIIIYVINEKMEDKIINDGLGSENNEDKVGFYDIREHFNDENK